MGYKNLCAKIIIFLLAFAFSLLAVNTFYRNISVGKSEKNAEPLDKIIYQSGGTGASGACHGNMSGASGYNKKSQNLLSETKPVQITSKPRPEYTDAARQNNVQGTVTLRVTFLANGEIGKISTINNLPFGLTEQAISAASNIKFKPAEKNGVSQTVTKQIQYSFTIY